VSGSDDGTTVLVLNCGSSSVKFALVEPVTGRRPVTGLAEQVGSPKAVLHVRRGDDTVTTTPADPSHTGVVAEVLDQIGGEPPRAVGHRVVHGGSRFSASVIVDDDVLAGIREISDLAPLHVPANLAGIEAAARALPGVPQVVVFDTAFHQTMPPRAYHYAVPRDWFTKHAVRRYGFHGTSHRYVSEQAAAALARPLGELRLVTAHLGNGCSAAAIRDGRSVDTTMGLTPLEGLVMGTRSGDVDPGLPRYVAERTGMSLVEVLDALNTRSGLLGLSGVSNDQREVADAADAGSSCAALAMEVFAYRLAKYVAALVVPLGRLDALVFTGGIGENSAPVRSDVLGLLGFLGLVEDRALNTGLARGSGGLVSSGPVPALVVPTDEELVIARDTAELVA